MTNFTRFIVIKQNEVAGKHLKNFPSYTEYKTKLIQKLQFTKP